MPRFKFLRVFSALISVHSLLLYSTQTLAKSSGVPVDEAIEIIKTGTDMYLTQQAASQRQIQNSIFSQNFANQYGLKPLGPAKYFPECKITETIQAIPIPFTQCPVGPDPTFSTFVMGLAQSHIDELDRMSKSIKPDYTRSDSSTVGVSCLENRKLDLQIQLNENIQKLTDMKTQFDLVNSEYKRDLEKIKSNIEEDHNLIYGGANKGENALTKNNPIGSLLKKDPVCVNILGAKNIFDFSSGLNGLLGDVFPHFTKADSFKTSPLQIKIESEVQRLQKQIASDGIFDFIEDGSYTSQIFNSLPARMKTVLDKAIAREKSEKAKLIKKIGRNFLNDDRGTKEKSSFEEMLTKGFVTDQSKDSIKKKRVESCIFGEVDDLAPAQSEILSMITQAGVTQTKVPNATNCSEENKDTSSALQYGCELYDYLHGSQKPTFSALKSFISSLNSKYQSYSIGLNHSGLAAGSGPDSIIGYYNDIEAKCSRNFENNVWPSYEDGLKKMNDFKTAQKTFPATLAQDMLEQMINCNNEPLEPSECSQDLFNSNSDNFCIQHANECREKINSCYNVIDRKISSVKTSLFKTSLQYNQKVDALVKTQNLNLTKINQVFRATGKLLEGIIKGALFKEADNLAIKFPEYGKKVFGVDLAGGGTMTFLDEINDKISSIQDRIQEQSDSANTLIETYIAKENKAIEKNRSDWDSLLNACNTAYLAANKAINKKNEETVKKRAEVEETCDKYASVIRAINRNNPSSICGGPIEDLTSSVKKVRGIISPNVKKDIGDIEIICNKTQAKESEEDATNEPDESALYNLCADNGFNADDSITDLESRLVNLIDDSKLKKKVKKILKNKKRKGSEDLPIKVQVAVDKILGLKKYTIIMKESRQDLLTEAEEKLAAALIVEKERNAKINPPATPAEKKEAEDQSALELKNMDAVKKLETLGYKDIVEGDFCHDLWNQAVAYTSDKTCPTKIGVGTTECTLEHIPEIAQDNYFKDYNSVIFKIDKIAGIGGLKYDFGEIRGGTCVYSAGDENRSNDPFNKAAKEAKKIFNALGE